MKHLYQFYLFLLLLYVTETVFVQYYPRYHLAPLHGWMGIPSGFCIFRNEYHLFYEYNPYSSMKPGTPLWGHAKTKNLFKWKHLPSALYPDHKYDKNGVLSGSVIVDKRKMYLFYTGNVNHPDKSPDHEQHQALATSKDGVNTTKYEGNPIIDGGNLQPNFRHPKVWEHKGSYYMVVGNSFDHNTRGRALLYTSSDKISWKQVAILAQSDGTLGYMWEYPDFFELNNQFVLMFSPLGIKVKSHLYQNLSQTGYIVGDFDYETNTFTPVSEFSTLDHGHDLYATQTLLDSDNRRIMVASLDTCDPTYPENIDGFTGQMSLPRVLSLDSDYRLIQTPVEEVEVARSCEIHSGKANCNTVVTLEDKSAEVKIEASMQRNLMIIINSVNTKVTIKYDYKEACVTVDRGGTNGVRRAKWNAIEKNLLIWTIYIDASSIELFCGKGELTFSSRYFPTGEVSIQLGENSEVDDMTIVTMIRTVPKPSEHYWNFE